MTTAPSVTIAICTYNRADYLRDTLHDLSRQTAEDFEILVINNNSTDYTETVCREFEEKNSTLNFRCVTETAQGLSHARNRAFAEAKSDHVLFIDDDVHLAKDFAEKTIQYIRQKPGIRCAGGRIFVSFDEGDPDWIPRELMPMFGLHDLGEASREYPKDNFPRGGNMLINKKAFQAVGPFNPDLGRIGGQLFGSEEKAFFDAARKAGFTCWYLPEMVLHHRIGKNRLEKEYLENQSVGIGRSEYLRLQNSFWGLTGKLFSEMIKLLGSVILAAGYLLKGKPGAARFILVFRFWVMRGFFRRQG